MAKLYFYYSTMNAGKSTALLQAAHNYAERGLSTRLFIARLDDRAGGRIASRIGLESPADRVRPGHRLLGPPVRVQSSLRADRRGPVPVPRPGPATGPRGGRGEHPGHVLR